LATEAAVKKGTKKAGDGTPGLEERLRQAITDCGVSLNQLARETGVHAAQLSRFVRGTRTLTLRAAAKVCAHLGLRLVGPDDTKK
jgi:plasmid maintenance system antidote protein VapI